MSEQADQSKKKSKPASIQTLISLVLGLFPLVLMGALGYRARHDPRQMAIILEYMWAVGGVISAWILYAQANIAGRPLREFNREAGSIRTDLLSSLGMAIILFIFSLLFGLFFPRAAGGAGFQTFDFFHDELAGDPLKAAAFLGVSLMLGVAFEELIRAFLLSRVWELLPSPKSGWIGIALCALAFGLAHAYEGLSAAFSASAAGLLLGFFYLRKGRILPLILSHYLYNLTAFILLIYF